MKKILLLLLLVLNTSFIFSQDEKLYSLREVEVAPKLNDYPIIDSLSTSINFQNNLMKYIAINADILTSHKSEINKVFVQFEINKDGYVNILQSKGPSKKAIKLAEKVIKNIKQITPAKINDQNVSMKYTVPIVFNTILISN